MEVTQNQLLAHISKEIWKYLPSKEITITAEYLPGALSKETDMQSQTLKDLSAWKLNQAVFENLCKTWTQYMTFFLPEFSMKF